MNRTEKIIAVVGVATLIIGALIIRHQEAGLLAYQKGDYPTAKNEFEILADRNDPWGAHFSGILLINQKSGEIDRRKAAEYFILGARLGNIRSAIEYIALLTYHRERNQLCPQITSLLDKAMQTHQSYAVLIKSQQLITGFCTSPKKVLGTHYYRWAADLIPQVGAQFDDFFNTLSKEQKIHYLGQKFILPDRINEATFLKYFLTEIDKINPLNIN